MGTYGRTCLCIAIHPALYASPSPEQKKVAGSRRRPPKKHRLHLTECGAHTASHRKRPSNPPPRIVDVENGMKNWQQHLLSPLLELSFAIGLLCPKSIISPTKQQQRLWPDRSDYDLCVDNMSEQSTIVGYSRACSICSRLTSPIHSKQQVRLTAYADSHPVLARQHTARTASTHGE